MEEDKENLVIAISGLEKHILRGSSKRFGLNYRSLVNAIAYANIIREIKDVEFVGKLLLKLHIKFVNIANPLLYLYMEQKLETNFNAEDMFQLVVELCNSQKSRKVFNIKNAYIDNKAEIVNHIKYLTYTKSDDEDIQKFVNSYYMWIFQEAINQFSFIKSEIEDYLSFINEMNNFIMEYCKGFVPDVKTVEDYVDNYKTVEEKAPKEKKKLLQFLKLMCSWLLKLQEKDLNELKFKEKDILYELSDLIPEGQLKRLENIIEKALITKVRIKYAIEIIKRHMYKLNKKDYKQHNIFKRMMSEFVKVFRKFIKGDPPIIGETGIKYIREFEDLMERGQKISEVGTDLFRANTFKTLENACNSFNMEDTRNDTLIQMMGVLVSISIPGNEQVIMNLIRNRIVNETDKEMRDLCAVFGIVFILSKKNMRPKYIPIFDTGERVIEKLSDTYFSIFKELKTIVDEIIKNEVKDEVQKKVVEWFSKKKKVLSIEELIPNINKLIEDEAENVIKVKDPLEIETESETDVKTRIKKILLERMNDQNIEQQVKIEHKLYTKLMKDIKIFEKVFKKKSKSFWKSKKKKNEFLTINLMEVSKGFERTAYDFLEIFEKDLYGKIEKLSKNTNVEDVVKFVHELGKNISEITPFFKNLKSQIKSKEVIYVVEMLQKNFTTIIFNYLFELAQKHVLQLESDDEMVYDYTTAIGRKRDNTIIDYFIDMKVTNMINDDFFEIGKSKAIIDQIMQNYIKEIEKIKMLFVQRIQQGKLGLIYEVEELEDSGEDDDSGEDSGEGEDDDSEEGDGEDDDDDLGEGKGETRIQYDDSVEMEGEYDPEFQFDDKRFISQVDGFFPEKISEFEDLVKVIESKKNLYVGYMKNYRDNVFKFLKLVAFNEAKGNIINEQRKKLNTQIARKDKKKKYLEKVLTRDQKITFMIRLYNMIVEIEEEIEENKGVLEEFSGELKNELKKDKIDFKDFLKNLKKNQRDEFLKIVGIEVDDSAEGEDEFDDSVEGEEEDDSSEGPSNFDEEEGEDEGEEEGEEEGEDEFDDSVEGKSEISKVLLDFGDLTEDVDSRYKVEELFKTTLYEVRSKYNFLVSGDNGMGTIKQQKKILTPSYSPIVMKNVFDKKSDEIREKLEEKVGEIIDEVTESEIVESEKPYTNKERILDNIEWVKENKTIFDDDFKLFVIDVADKYINFAQSIIGKSNRKAFLQEIFFFYNAKDPSTEKIITENVLNFLERHSFKKIEEKREALIDVVKEEDRNDKNELVKQFVSYKEEMKLSNNEGYKLLFTSGGILLNQASWKRIQFHIDNFGKEIDDKILSNFVIKILKTKKSSEATIKKKKALGQKTPFQTKFDQLKQTQIYFNEGFAKLTPEERSKAFKLLKRIEAKNKILQDINNAEEYKDIYYENMILGKGSETRLVLALLHASLQVEKNIGDEVKKMRLGFISETTETIIRLRNKIREIEYVFSDYDFEDFLVFWVYIFNDEVLKFLNDESFQESNVDELVSKIRDHQMKELKEEFGESEAKEMAEEAVDREGLKDFYKIYNQFDKRVKSSFNSEFDKGHLFIEIFEQIRFSANEIKGKMDSRDYEKSFNEFKDSFGFPETFSDEVVKKLIETILELNKFIEKVENPEEEEEEEVKVVEQDETYFQRDENEEDADNDIKKMKVKGESKKITVEFFYDAQSFKNYEVIEIEMDLNHKAKSYFEFFATKIDKKLIGLDFYLDNDNNKMEMLDKDKVIDLYLKNGSKIRAVKKDLYTEDEEENVEIIVRLPLRYNVRSDEQFLQDLDEYANKVFKINDLKTLGGMKRKLYKKIEKHGITRDKERIKYEICQNLLNTFKIIEMVVFNK